MPKFLIEVNMDGYDTEEEEIEACKEFIEEQLDFSASSVKILKTIKEKAFIKVIDYCANCDEFDDNGGCGGQMCNNPDFPRQKNGVWLFLDDTIDPYNEIHELCPLIK